MRNKAPGQATFARTDEATYADSKPTRCFGIDVGFALQKFFKVVGGGKRASQDGGTKTDASDYRSGSTKTGSSAEGSHRHGKRTGKRTSSSAKGSRDSLEGTLDYLASKIRDAFKAARLKGLLTCNGFARASRSFLTGQPHSF